MPATKTLQQCAREAIESKTENAPDGEPVILWWDEGGYLRDLVESESHSLGYRFRAATETPLELRAEAPRERTVWYVPQPQTDDVDWFRDIENAGGIVEAHIGKLSARFFEDDRLQAGAIRTAYEDAEDREEVAQTLGQELTGNGGLPSLQALQTKIILGGHHKPVQFDLENGEENLSTGDELLQIRDLLFDDGVAAVEVPLTLQPLSTAHAGGLSPNGS